MELPICYEDEHLIAVHKPSGLLVHRSKIDRTARTFALQTVRNMVGHHVYPVHRLDKPTSGVLLFAKTPEIAQQVGQQFATHAVNKVYIAVVRGFPSAHGYIDRPLAILRDKTTDELARTDSEPQPAQTAYVRLATATLPLAIGRYPTARYALLAVQTATGRQHQIRRHLNGIAHPILGDYKHGDYRHNRAIESAYGIMRLFLHAAILQVTHPVSSERLTITASVPYRFRQLLAIMEWEEPAKDRLQHLDFPSIGQD